jgi:acetamidase/formamidase
MHLTKIFQLHTARCRTRSIQTAQFNAASFRVTQVVDVVRGVHALIPKTIFAPDLRREMTVV